jgi:hypothetical protein
MKGGACYPPNDAELSKGIFYIKTPSTFGGPPPEPVRKEEAGISKDGCRLWRPVLDSDDRGYATEESEGGLITHTYSAK